MSSIEYYVKTNGKITLEELALKIYSDENENRYDLFLEPLLGTIKEDVTVKCFDNKENVKFRQGEHYLIAQDINACGYFETLRNKYDVEYCQTEDFYRRTTEIMKESVKDTYNNRFEAIVEYKSVDEMLENMKKIQNRKSVMAKLTAFKNQIKDNQDIHREDKQRDAGMVKGKDYYEH